MNKMTDINDIDKYINDVKIFSLNNFNDFDIIKSEIIIDSENMIKYVRNANIKRRNQKFGKSAK